MLDIKKYEIMATSGASPKDICLTLIADGLDGIQQIYAIRKLFNFSLTEAKELLIVAQDLANSLDEYQGQIAAQLENYYDNETLDEDTKEPPPSI